VGVRVCQRASGTEWRQVLLGARDHSPERKKKGQRPLTVWSYAGVTERVFGRLEAVDEVVGCGAHADDRVGCGEQVAVPFSDHGSQLGDFGGGRFAASGSWFSFRGPLKRDGKRERLTWPAVQSFLRP
jgi:hypothetical protein